MNKCVYEVWRDKGRPGGGVAGGEEQEKENRSCNFFLSQLGDKTSKWRTS